MWGAVEQNGSYLRQPENSGIAGNKEQENPCVGKKTYKSIVIIS